MRPFLQFEQLLRQLVALLPEHCRVDQHARVFHVEQHRHQRLLDFLVEPAQRGYLVDPRPQRLVEPQRDVGILGGVFASGFERDVGEWQLLCTLARHVLVANGLNAEVVPRHGIHVVPRRGTVEHVGLEHRVVFHSPKFDAVVAQHVGVVLEVVAELRARGILEQRLQAVEHLGAIELVRHVGAGVRERHVSGAAGLHAE